MVHSRSPSDMVSPYRRKHLPALLGAQGVPEPYRRWPDSLSHRELRGNQLTVYPGRRDVGRVRIIRWWEFEPHATTVKALVKDDISDAVIYLASICLGPSRQHS
jgi:hypothetical protein